MLQEERFFTPPRQPHKYYFIQLLQTSLKERNFNGSVLQRRFFGCCYFAQQLCASFFRPSTLFLSSSSSSREVNGAMIKLFCIHFGALVLLPLEDFNCTSQFAAFVAITCNYRGAVTIWRFEAGNCNGRSRRNGEICAICIDVINESNLKL